jgi:hypothetical protein
MNLRIACLLVAALAGSASADTKSFTAVKSKLPGAAAVVVGIDLKAVRATPSFPKLLDVLFGEARELKLGVDTVKAMCAIDALAALSDVTVSPISTSRAWCHRPERPRTKADRLHQQDPRSGTRIEATGKPSKPGKVTGKLAGRTDVLRRVAREDVVASAWSITRHARRCSPASRLRGARDHARKTNPNALAFGGVCE